MITKISEAIKEVGKYGSVEIYIQDGKVTQVTIRKIEKIKNGR